MARLPVCGFTLQGQSCNERGPHFCLPRAARAVGFFEGVLVHTKGRWARKAFILADWQRDEIIEPVFGPVVWSEDWECYTRQIRQLDVEVARKSGKSEIAAGIALLLICADDETSSEVYGCARDRDQARKVYDVAEAMVTLSPLLSKRLVVKSSAKRIIDPRTNSYYEIIAADAAGNLGHNPHGVIMDERLTQRDGRLWGALRTAIGTRVQPLLARFTTADNDPASWSTQEHGELQRIEEDPSRAPHRHVFLRNLPKNPDEVARLHRIYPAHPDLPVSDDVWDERNWKWPNPGLGQFLFVRDLRTEAQEARSQPVLENEFRQLRANQYVQMATRWIPLHLWDAIGGLVVESDLRGRQAFAGLDLSAITDLTAWVLFFPSSAPGEPNQVLWRFWTNEAQIPFLNRHTGGLAEQWVKQGFLVASPGSTIDYDAIHKQIGKDIDTFDVVRAGYDQKDAESTRQFMVRLLDEDRVLKVAQGFTLSPGLKELMRQVKSKDMVHGGNPVARWNADSAEVDRSPDEYLKLKKPERDASGKRVDGIAALADALFVWLEYVEQMASVYEEREPMVL